MAPQPFVTAQPFDKRLRLNAVDVLVADLSVKDIRFRRGKLAIDASSFPAVARAIFDGLIKVVFDTHHKHVPKGANARYSIAEKTLYLTRRPGYFDDAANSIVIHEACHISQHLRSVGKVPALESEVGGYIVQCIYLISHDIDLTSLKRYVSRSGKGLTRNAEEAWEAAFTLALHYLGGRGNDNLVNTNLALYEHKLKTALMIDDAYRQRIHEIYDYTWR